MDETVRSVNDFLIRAIDHTNPQLLLLFLFWPSNFDRQMVGVKLMYTHKSRKQCIVAFIIAHTALNNNNNKNIVYKLISRK